MEKVLFLDIRFVLKFEDIENLLDCASRGAGYWASSNLMYESEVKNLMAGKDIVIVDKQNDKGGRDGIKLTLNFLKVEEGFAIMAQKDHKAFAAFMDGDYDDDTGDTFLQCALFGEVIYG